MRKIISSIFALVLIHACNLDLAPENVMVDQNVYSNAKTSQAALLGVYSRMNIFLGGAPEDQNNYSYKSLCWVAGDVGTGNLKARDGGASDIIALEECSYDNAIRDGSILSSWIKGYNAIDYANNIIDGVGRYADYDKQLAAGFIAEAKFIRAFVYFNMLKMFGDGALTGNDAGLGMILREKPYDGYNPDQIMPRSTVKATWDFIISDLEEAIESLPESAGQPQERFRASRPAAWALLSRVYLYKGSYKNDPECMGKAVDFSRKILDSGEYSFLNVFNDHKVNIFPANEYSVELASNYPDPAARSGEIILYQPSRISIDKYSNGVSLLFYEKRDFRVEREFVSSLYLPGDLRGMNEKSAFSMIGTGGVSYHPNDITSLKYTNSAGYDDIVFFRLSEIKLNFAEALTRQSNSVMQEAIDHLNDIRLKPFAEEDRPEPLKVSDFGSAKELLDEILLERNRELAYESHRRWDLIRTGGKLRNESATDGQKILPIPDYEVNISKGVIEQNPAFK